MEVTSEREKPRQGRLSTPVLIGRDSELRMLADLAGSPPAVILLEGEAGVGKSRLVREMAHHPELTERRVLIGHCHRMREPFPLGPFVEALREIAEEPPAEPLSGVAGALRPLLPELAPHLPPPPDPLSDPRAERHRAFRGLRALLGALGPTVCVLEDMHWADEGTLELLSFLVSEPPTSLSLVLTYRGEDLDPSSQLEGLTSRPPGATSRAMIGLSRLPVEDVGRLAAALLDAPEVPGELALALYRQTAGVPFAIEELVRLLLDSGDLTAGDQQWPDAVPDRVAVPPAVRHSVLARLRPLGAAARLVARAAAVLERPSDETLLRKVAGLSPTRCAKGLEEALSGAVLDEEDAGIYRCRHSLAAQAVYSDIPTAQRSRLHLRAASALEAGPEPRPLAQIAHHFKQADRPRKWLRYAEAAAEAAHRAGDDSSAAQVLEEALQVPRLSRAARVRMAISLGQAALYSPSPQPAIAALERALQEKGLSAGIRGELRFSALRLRTRVGQTDGWWEEMLVAIEELRRRPELAVRAMLNLALVRPWLSNGNLEEHLAWLRRAEQVAARQNDRVANIAVSAQRAAVLLSVGDPEAWDAVDQIPAEVCSIDEKLQLMRGYGLCSAAAAFLGYHRHGESLMAEAERIHREVGHVWYELWLESSKASLDWAMGRWEGLESRTRELATRRRGSGRLPLDLEMIRASLLLRRGEVEETKRAAESVRDEARRIGSFGSLAQASGLLTEIHLAAGRMEAARDAAAQATDELEPNGFSLGARTVAPAAVQAFLACDERAKADEFVRRFAAGMRKRDAPAARAALACCRAELADANGFHERAGRAFGQAERIWRDLPSPYEAARARERRGCSLLRRRDQRGGDYLVSAHEEYERLGASWDAARVRTELRAGGLALLSPWRGGRKGYGAQLSPREGQVARLAGMGKTNREIAETLVISPHTAAHHVSAALRKLGLHSRQELTATNGVPEKDS